MSFDLETFYSLLPAVYRIRDLEQAENNLLLSDLEQDLARDDPRLPLQALLKVITEQIVVIEENLAQLYDDQFIETCADWVIPYIGDLVGYHTPYNISSQSLRGEVANTIGYRRRKGTATLLEQLVRDVSGWSAHVVEYFRLLAATQHMNRSHPGNSLIDLRLGEPLERLDTPFDSLVHTVDVRNIAAGRGRYNIPSVGIFIWRLFAYHLTDVPAVKLDDYRYLFSPLGNNLQLFSLPHIEEDVTQLAGPPAVAMPLSRGMLPHFPHFLSTYYGPEKSLLLTVDGKDILPDPKQPLQKLSDLLTISDLSDGEDRELEDGNSIWENMPEETIAIDPVLGRIAFPKNKQAPGNVHSTFHYGFSANIGGGEYSRADSFNAELTTIEQVPSPHLFIQEALAALSGSGVVEITDSGRNGETPTIHVAANQRIELRAADFQRPLLVLENVGAQFIAPETQLPEMSISGEEGAQVTINGLVISGGRLRVTGKLDRLTLRHCTLVPGLCFLPGSSVPQYPGEPSLIVESANAVVEIDHCIMGGLRVVENAKVQITNSIVDATSECGVAYAAPKSGKANGQTTKTIMDTTTQSSEVSATSEDDQTDVRIKKTSVDASMESDVVYASADEDSILGGPLHIENSTIIGIVQTATLELASNTIFLACLPSQDDSANVGASLVSALYAERRQEGCVRYSYVPAGSRVPRRYRCVGAGTQNVGTSLGGALAERLRPQFTSLRYGDAGYCQLRWDCPAEIKGGADDEAEMGAFHDLFQPQRKTNLRVRLDEYLRFTMEPGIIYIT